MLCTALYYQCHLFQAVFELSIAHHQNIKFVPRHQTDLKSWLIFLPKQKKLDQLEDLVRDARVEPVQAGHHVRHVQERPPVLHHLQHKECDISTKN